MGGGPEKEEGGNGREEGRVAAIMHKKGVSHVNYTNASPLHINLPNIHI